MKKICMIIPKNLPLPAVKGGAIETLVTNVIIENEKENKLDLTVVSIYDKNAEKVKYQYKTTKFIYIKTKSFKYKLKAFWFRILKQFNIEKNTYNEFVLKAIKNENYDYIFVEDGAYNSFHNYLKYFPKEKMVLHLHHTVNSTKEINATFDKVVTVSHYVKNVFINNSTIKKICVLPNSVTINNFTKKINENERIQLRKQLGFSNNDYIVLYCGRLAKEKGVIELVKAINNIKEKNVKLLIVGSINFASKSSDSYTHDLEIEASKKNKVIFTGFVPNDLLYKYYNISDLMIIPSLWEEAAGLVCIEGMLSRKPIITTGRGGIKEYVKDYAIYVDYNNVIKELQEKIIYCYNHQDELIDRTNKAFNYALKYSTQNYYNNLIKMIEKEF